MKNNTTMITIEIHEILYCALAVMPVTKAHTGFEYKQNSFKGRNFREFQAKSRKFNPRKMPKGVIRESLFPRNMLKQVIRGSLFLLKNLNLSFRINHKSVFIYLLTRKTLFIKQSYIYSMYVPQFFYKFYSYRQVLQQSPIDIDIYYP